MSQGDGTGQIIRLGYTSILNFDIVRLINYDKFLLYVMNYEVFACFFLIDFKSA